MNLSYFRMAPSTPRVRGWGWNAMSPRKNRWVRTATKCHLAGDANLMWSQVWFSYCDICTMTTNTDAKILHKILANDFLKFIKTEKGKGPEISISREYPLGYRKIGCELSVFICFCIY